MYVLIYLGQLLKITDGVQPIDIDLGTSLLFFLEFEADQSQGEDSRFERSQTMMLQTRGQFDFEIDVFVNERLLTRCVFDTLDLHLQCEQGEVLRQEREREIFFIKPIDRSRVFTHHFEEIDRRDKISEPIEFLQNQPFHAK
jgi:hypothetical protein